ncbi:MAG: hypothetical protein WCL00_10180 [Bacteroidota bacterium]
MKKLYFLLAVLGLLICNVNIVAAFNPKDLLTGFKVANCSPNTSITVTLTNNPAYCPAMSCIQWKVSVWETDGTNSYQIGDGKPLTTQTTYTWTGLDWDNGTYYWIYLQWDFVENDPHPPCQYVPPTQFKSALQNPSSSLVNFTNFYPCQ